MAPKTEAAVAISVARQIRVIRGQRVLLDEDLAASDEQNDELVVLDEALERFAQIDTRKSRVVELRYFGGLSVEETATVLEVSPATVKRDWDVARAWLHRELHRESENVC